MERECASLFSPCLAEASRIFGCNLDYLVLGEPHDGALKKLPKTILSILESGDEEEVKRLVGIPTNICGFVRKICATNKTLMM